MTEMLGLSFVKQRTISESRVRQQKAATKEKQPPTKELRTTMLLYTKRCEKGHIHSHMPIDHLLVKDGHGNGKRLKGTYRVKVNGKSIVFHLANLFTHQHPKKSYESVQTEVAQQQRTIWGLRTCRRGRLSH